MPGFYEGEPVARISGELRAEEYAQAWVMLEQRYGTLRTAGKKALALAVMLVLCCCLLPWYAARYASFYIPAVVAALCLFGIWWQLLYRPAAAYRRGIAKLSQQPADNVAAQLTLYRDSYFIQNQYEEKKRLLDGFCRLRGNRLAYRCHGRLGAAYAGDSQTQCACAGTGGIVFFARKHLCHPLPPHFSKK